VKRQSFCQANYRLTGQEMTFPLPIQKAHLNKTENSPPHFGYLKLYELTQHPKQLISDFFKLPT